MFCGSLGLNFGVGLKSEINGHSHLSHLIDQTLGQCHKHEQAELTSSVPLHEHVSILWSRRTSRTILECLVFFFFVFLYFIIIMIFHFYVSVNNIGED